MALFRSNRDLFELIPRVEGGLAPRSGGDDELFSVGGKTLVIVDEWPEGGVATAAPEREDFTLRKDTAIVVGVVAAVLVLLAFLAGRATVRDGSEDGPEEQASKPSLPEGVFDPNAPRAQPPQAQPLAQPTPQVAPQAQPAAQPAAPGPAAPQAVTPVAAGSRRAADGSHELCVVTTVADKAEAVAKYLNEDPASPIAGRQDLEAYLHRGRQVRIKGFHGEDGSVLAKVQAMKDPTGGGSFSGALFRKVR